MFTLKKNNHEGCVILATTSPSQPTEKKQAKTFQELGFKVILVASDSKPREMEGHLDKYFVSVRDDLGFPANLITYLKDQQIII